MVCPHCGENNPDNAKYCQRCSATLPRKQRPQVKNGGSAPSRGGGGMEPKTILIIILAVLVVIMGFMFIRSKLSSKSGEVTEEETEAKEETTEEESEEATEEKSEEAEDEAKAEESSGPDWLEEHGISLSTTEDDFKFHTMLNNGEEDDKDIEVTSSVTISESTENAPDGYKVVSAVFTYDISESEGERGIIADGAFDRYTGTYFGFDEKQPEQEDAADEDGFVRITNGDDHYDIAVSTSKAVNYPKVSKTIRIVCPEDYDGAVFFSGSDSLELDAKVRELDPAADLYTYDKLPFMDKDNSKDTDDDSEESDSDAGDDKDDSDSDDSDDESEMEYRYYYFTKETTSYTGGSSWGLIEVEQQQTTSSQSSDASVSSEPRRR